MNIEEYIESGQLELFVFDQLSPAERAEAEQLAAQHPQVQAEIDRIRQSLDAYAEAHAVPVPEGMRERVLSGWQQAIRKDAQPTVPFTPAPADPTGDVPPARETVVRSLPAAEPGSGRAARWLAAAAVILLLISAGANMLLYSRWKSAETALLIAQNEQSRYAASSQVMERRLGERQQELAVLRDAQFRPVVMTGTKVAPEARARVLYNPNTRAVYVDVNSLPAAPEGKQYQLWALDNGKPVDAGMILAETANGEMLQRMKDVASAQAFAVTLEPAGGRPTPTMEALTVVGQM